MRLQQRLSWVLVAGIVIAAAAGATAAEPVRVEVVSDSGDRIVLSYAIGDYRLEPASVGGEAYDRVVLAGEPTTFEKGAPELPFVSRSVIVPDEAEVAVRVLAFRFEDVAARVLPSKGVLPRTIDPDVVPYVFGPAYSADSFYPGALTVLGEPYVLRDRRGVVVELRPFQYNPVTGVLRVYREVTLEVTAVGSGGANVLRRDGPGSRPSEAFEELYRSHFLNYDDEPDFYAPVDEQGEMLVIAYDSWIANLDSFVAHKEAMGIPTTVVGVSTIGNTATSIKSYIQSVYDSGDLAFVLLVGDSEQVATPIRAVGAEQGAADPRYSKLAGGDNYPDIMVGRFSASTAAEVDTQVERTIQYEDGPATSLDWFKRGVGIASSQGLGQGDEGQADYQHMDEIRGWLLNDGYTLVDRIYDPSATDAQVSAAVNAGRGVINYCGHGSSSSWGTSGFNTADVDALTNDSMLPFVFSVACNNGEFHHYDKCFAEAWLRATNEATGAPAGAIGMYASSVSQSWAPPMEAQDEFNLRLTDTSRPYRSLGALYFAGSCSMMDKYGADGVEMFDTWNIFGDPSVRVVVPSGIEVTPEWGLVASGNPGGPYDPTTLTYTITNNDGVPVDYEVTSEADWISVSGSRGSLAPQATATVVVSLNDGSRNLDVGEFSVPVRFTNLTNRKGDTTRPVNLSVGGQTTLRTWQLTADPGWSRQGEWQFGQPLGNGGGQGFGPDPASGATGANVFGANLAGNIAKGVNGPWYLTLGPVDLTGCGELKLGFERWLNAPAPPEVRSTVEVSRDGISWSPVWSATALMAESAWSHQTIDIASVADGGAAVYVRWGYEVAQRVSNAGSGWNIDDVAIQGRPGTARITLLVERESLGWSAIPGAERYDLVRGSLETLRATGGDFAAATESCIGSDVAGTSLAYSAVPAPDAGHWLLVRGDSAAGAMTWQTLSGRQVGLRDEGINGSGASCP